MNISIVLCINLTIENENCANINYSFMYVKSTNNSNTQKKTDISHEKLLPRTNILPTTTTLSQNSSAFSPHSLFLSLALSYKSQLISWQ